jgi:hypothetical protein
MAAALMAAMLASGCSPTENGSPAPPSPSQPPSIETLRSALSERDELERTYELTRYLRELSPDDIPGVLVEIERQRVGITADEVRLFMLAWTRFDGPGAFETATSWPTTWKKVLTEQAMQAWGFNDGKAAFAAWERIQDKDLQETLRGALVAGWVGSYDIEGVTEFAATVEKPRRRNRLAFRLTGQVMRDGPEAVIAWADAVPIEAPNDFKQTVYSHALGAVARVDPELAAPWYERHIAEPFSAMTLRNVAIKWAQHHDPLALIAWVEGLPLDDSREAERADAIRAAMRIWAPADPENAERWLKSAPSSPGRDAAIGEFVRATIDSSPVEAMLWAAEIEDQALRKKTTLRLGRVWIEKDPDGATAWIRASDIPDVWRAAIMKNRPATHSTADAAHAEPDA